MSILYHREDTPFAPKEKRKLTDWIRKTVNEHQRNIGDLNFIFCSDNFLLNLNKSYLNHHYFTDVITFDLAEDSRISGDVFISVDKVRSNAEEFNVSFENELKRVMIHGVLHLLGFNDDTEENSSSMRLLEDKALSLWEE
ncbi:MAG: rRNA maturation RNase YbeY [Bacteroidota bacterium]